MKNKGYELYEVNNNVICLKCGHAGAVQPFGTWYPNGLGEFESSIPNNPYLKYKDKPFMSHALGFGGTIPWRCTNCGNIGLIDFGGLEGYKQAFKSKGE